MKTIATWLLLAGMAFADGRWRPVLKPYRRELVLNWCQIPYPQWPMELTLRDGYTYQIRNPEGHACEEGFGAPDNFECYVTIELDVIWVDSAREIKVKRDL